MIPLTQETTLPNFTGSSTVRVYIRDTQNSWWKEPGFFPFDSVFSSLFMIRVIFLEGKHLNYPV